MKFSGVKILQGVEISIFLLIFEWALQQCSATALPVIEYYSVALTSVFDSCGWQIVVWTETTGVTASRHRDVQRRSLMSKAQCTQAWQKVGMTPTSTLTLSQLKRWQLYHSSTLMLCGRILRGAFCLWNDWNDGKTAVLAADGKCGGRNNKKEIQRAERAERAAHSLDAK